MSVSAICYKNGSEYEPVTFRSFISSIDSHLKSSISKLSNVTSFEFSTARIVLKLKQIFLKKQGLRNHNKN